MGVLKVRDGSAWRDVGQGGTSGVTTGRLKLWTGTGWVREKFDDDTGPTVAFADDFNRADETPVAVSSSGAPWGPGINGYAYLVSNRARMTAHSNPGAQLVDLGIVAQDLTVRSYRSSTAGYGYLILASDSTLTAYFAVRWDGGSSLSVDKFGGGGGNWFVSGVTGWTGGSALIRATYDPSTGAFQVWVDGTSVLSFTDTGTALTGTYGGFGGSAHYSTTGEEFDDFDAPGSAAATPLVGKPLKLWDGTQWVTVAEMVPV